MTYFKKNGYLLFNLGVCAHMCECRCEHVMKLKDQLGYSSSCSTLVETVLFIFYCVCQTSSLPASKDTKRVSSQAWFIYFLINFFLFAFFIFCFICENLPNTATWNTDNFTISVHSEKSIQGLLPRSP